MECRQYFSVITGCSERLCAVSLLSLLSRMRASRARVVSALLSASTILSFFPAATFAFSDVSSRAEFSTAIEALQTRGVIEGYSDGTFKPTATINRAEFLKIVLESKTQDFEKNTEGCFPDVKSSDWFAPYVCTAKAMDIVAGYPDGLFHPERDINFVEAAKIVTLAYKQQVQGGAEWYEGYARALESSKAIPPSINGLEAKINRGEMAEIMWRLSEAKTDQPSKGFLNVKYPEVEINFAADSVQTAKSCVDLRAFVSEAQVNGGVQYGRGGGPTMLMEGAMAPQANNMKAADSAATTGSDYSQTNVQVAGVDEGDIVKTDGTYLYVVTTGKVRIVQAQPATNLKLISTIDLEENAFTPSDLYVDGNRLVVLGQRWTPYTGGPHIMDSSGSPQVEKRAAGDASMMIWPGPWYGAQKAEVRIYDITNRSNPTLERKVAFDGSTVSSRRIEDKLYIIVNNPVIWGGPGPIPLKATEEDLLPKVDDSKTGVRPIADCNDIAILPHVPSPQYLTVGVIPLTKPTTEIKSTTVLGSAENVYASLSNLYIATTEWNYNWNNVNPQSSEKTNVFRFAYADDGIDLKTQGSVPGHLLNQFSMDENDNTFRIATTVSSMWNNEKETKSTNNLYVLNMSMQRTGAIEDIAPGEQIYSARFLGDRAYMVTFKTVDPLFVIDLSDATNPKILGKLKIPGYSNYLHPYDENHLIGFGKEVDESIDKDKVHTDDAVYYTAIQGMKVAIFDVTDVENPKELHKVVIGERGTESPLLQNHKALLFDKERGLLSFPIMVTKKEGNSTEPSPIFQGAYVYTINLKDGIKLRGTITHYSDAEIQKAGGYWYGGEKDIQRIVRIGSDLLTISNTDVQSHSEETVKK